MNSEADGPSCPWLLVFAKADDGNGSGLVAVEAPREAIVRYPDGPVNRWNKAERPSVYVENGHVAAMTLAVIDVEKEQDKGNDGHGSKVIVIPLDGAALDRDLQSTSESPKP
ncbi:MAG: hypothetical protein ABSG04_01690 [Verrucomicrobiota bacterium]